MPLPDSLAQHAELFFRTINHTTVPLHAALVEQLCRSAPPPLGLATVLEDVGQAYLRLAERLNQALIHWGALDQEPEADDTDEARIDAFVTAFLATADQLPLADETTVDVRKAIEAAPFVADAMRTALVMVRLPAPPVIA